MFEMGQSRRKRLEELEPADYRPDEIVIPVVRRVDLSFDGRASGTVERITLASAVDVTEWVHGTFAVILHAKNAWLTAGGGATTGQASFIVENTSLEPDAPDVAFIDTSRTVGAGPTIVSATTAPLYGVSELMPPFGPQLRVSARFVQGASAAGGPQTLVVSIYLVGRRK